LTVFENLEVLLMQAGDGSSLLSNHYNVDEDSAHVALDRSWCARHGGLGVEKSNRGTEAEEATRNKNETDA